MWAVRSGGKRDGFPEVEGDAEQEQLGAIAFKPEIAHAPIAITSFEGSKDAFNGRANGSDERVALRLPVRQPFLVLVAAMHDAIRLP